MLAHQLLVGLGAAEGEGRFMFVHPAGFEPAKVSRDIKVRRSRDSHQEEEHIYPHPAVFIELCTLADLRGTVPRESEYTLLSSSPTERRWAATYVKSSTSVFDNPEVSTSANAEVHFLSLINLCLLSLDEFLWRHSD